MYTLMLIAANSIPGAILFLVLVAILKQMPEEESAEAPVAEPKAAPEDARSADRSGGFMRPAGSVG